MGINVSEEYGGSGLDSLALSIAVEEISRLDITYLHILNQKPE